MSQLSETDRLLDDLPSIPRDTNGPVFAEPWHAQAFALTLSLHKAGLFDWTEWASMLGATLEDARQNGDPDTGDTYYQHWLTALERIVFAKGLASPDQLSGLRHAWQDAARSTPHGKPIILPDDWRQNVMPD
ncbi:nitrile hydratase accessory protein [Coralliovum pocilloporae]|uniref:nitrile hydratase accessory protein n=1 Tax=Coralliovum pocilloporae TaxID=3066369 RepID=UPI003306B0EF